MNTKCEKIDYFLLLFAFAWALLQLFIYFETVIVIFAFAAILAALLNYPVRWLRRSLLLVGA